MQSIILETHNTKTITTYMSTFCKSHTITPIDTISITPEDTTTSGSKRNQTSLGIGDIRKLQQQLYLAPIQSPAKVIILYQAQTLTIEAQNALLKMLEEPPDRTFIVLVVTTIESLLPTILSRCSLVKLDNLPETTRKDDDIQTLIPVIDAKKLGEQLHYAEQFGKTKEEAVRFLERLIPAIRANLIKSIDKNNDKGFITSYLTMLQASVQTYHVLKTTNTNPRLTLENLFLSLTN